MPIIMFEGLSFVYCCVRQARGLAHIREPSRLHLPFCPRNAGLTATVHHSGGQSSGPHMAPALITGPSPQLGPSTSEPCGVVPPLWGQAKSRLWVEPALSFTPALPVPPSLILPPGKRDLVLGKGRVNSIQNLCKYHSVPDAAP